MKRDMALIRELLLKLEGIPLRSGGILHLTGADPEVQIDGFDSNAIEYHLELIRGAHLIDDGNLRPMSGIGFKGFTWAGHDFVDSIRDPEIWKKTNGALKEAGGFSLELVKALAKGFVKKQVELRTGIELDF